MEFKRNPHNFRPTRPTPLTPDHPKPADLKVQREEFGFDDIPVDDEPMDDVRFRDIIRAWSKQAIKHSPLEKKLQQGKTKKGRLGQLKNDLKWALQADLDEPVKPVKPAVNQPPRRLVVPPRVNASVNPTPNAQHDTSKTIDINISLDSLPKLPRPNLSLLAPLYTKLLAAYRAQSRKRLLILAGATVVVVIGIIVAASLIHQYELYVKNGGTSSAIAQAPNYDTLLPSGKTIQQLGGWQRISPPNSNPVFAYGDMIDSTLVSVSEQPLPASFKTDVAGKTQELAKSFSANDVVHAGDLTVYVGTSAQGPQSAIFTKNNLLVLIKSQSKVNDKSWATYAQSLN